MQCKYLFVFWIFILRYNIDYLEHIKLVFEYDCQNLLLSTLSYVAEHTWYQVSVKAKFRFKLSNVFKYTCYFMQGTTCFGSLFWAADMGNSFPGKYTIIVLINIYYFRGGRHSRPTIVVSYDGITTAFTSVHVHLVDINLIKITLSYLLFTY